MKHMRTEQKLKAVFVFLALLNDIAQSRKPSWGTILWRHWANSWKLLIWRKHSRLSLGKSIIFPWVFPEDTSLQLRYLVSVSLTHLSYLFVFSLLFANCFDPSIKRKPSLVSHVISLLHTPCLSGLFHLCIVPELIQAFLLLCCLNSFHQLSDVYHTTLLWQV